MRCGAAVERVNKMNDRELLYWKFQRRFSTQQLLTRFPLQRKQIAEVALLDLNFRTLHKLIHQKGLWVRIQKLKKQYREIQLTVSKRNPWDKGF